MPIIHGIDFPEPWGTCNRCGSCCIGCSHLRIDSVGTEPGGLDLTTCLIYDTRADFCEEHGETHEECIAFPEHPWLWVIRDGICTMTMIPEGRGDEPSDIQIAVDELSAAFGWGQT